MPTEIQKTDEALRIVQTALDLGVLNLSQADLLVDAVEAGEVTNPLQWMAEKKLVTDEMSERIRELVDNPDSIENRSPFTLPPSSKTPFEVPWSDAEVSAPGSEAALEALWGNASETSKTSSRPHRRIKANEGPTRPGSKSRPETPADDTEAEASARPAPTDANAKESTQENQSPSESELLSSEQPPPIPPPVPEALGKNDKAAHCGQPSDGASEAGGLAREQQGRYTFRYVHASGGQARILVVHDEQIGRDVALKEVIQAPSRRTDAPAPAQGTPTPASQNSVNSAEMQRLLREARVTGQLEHPNIVPVYDLGKRQNGALYYTMRFVRGVTLSQRLKACRRLSERLRLLKPFLDLCNAIAYAHSRGVIHRDLKPANAMVGEFGETILLDWGVAKVRHQEEIRGIDTSNEARLLNEDGVAKTVAGEAIGTPAYMSPEQASGQLDRVDERSDVFGLGAILYQILTGQPPYQGGNGDELIIRASRGKIQSVRSVEPQAPRPLAAIAEKALQADPAARYQTAKELAEEIDSYMTGGKVAAYAYSSRELLLRFAQKNRLLLSGIVFLFVIICASLVAVTESLKQEKAANTALTEARAQEHAERLTANLNLAEMHAMDAGRFIALNRFASAEKSALLSLLHNPAHPLSPFHAAASENFLTPKARFIRILAASALYQARQRSFIELKWSFAGSEAMTAPAFSPDSRHLAVGSYDGKLRILDTETGALVHVHPGHHSRINSVAFSPDGRLLASSAQESDVLVREVDSSEPAATLSGHRRAVKSVAFSPDGRLLASASLDGDIRLWDMTSFKCLAVFSLPGGSQTVEANAVLFARDGQSLFVGASDGTLSRIRLSENVLSPSGTERGAVQSTSDIQVIYRRAGEIWSLARSSVPHRAAILVSGRTEHSIAEISEDGVPLLTLEGHANGISETAFAPNGRILSASYDTTLRIWSGLSGAPLLTAEGHRDFVSGTAVSPSGEFIASTSFDKTVRLWRIADTKLRQFTGHTEMLHDATFSPDGKLIASGGWDRVVRVWDAETGRELHALSGHVSAVTGLYFSGDSQKLLSSSRDGTARLWNLAAEAPETPITVITNPDISDIGSAAISPDGTIAATGSAGQMGSVYLWDAATGKHLRTLEGHTGLVSGMLFSRDGKRLVTAGRDKSVILFETETGKILSRIDDCHGDWLSDVAWADPDERTIFTAGKDGLVIKWDLDSGRELLRLSGHSQWVNGIELSESGRFLATASDDKSVRLWDARTGELLLIISTVTEATAISFSLDEKYLAVGDGTLLSLYPLDFSLLEVDPAQELKSLSGAEEAAPDKSAKF